MCVGHFGHSKVHIEQCILLCDGALKVWLLFQSWSFSQVDLETLSDESADWQDGCVDITNVERDDNLSILLIDEMNPSVPIYPDVSACNCPQDGLVVLLHLMEWIHCSKPWWANICCCSTVDHDVDSCEQLILRWGCLSNLVDCCNCLCVDVHHGVDGLCCLWSWGIWWCCWLCCVLLLLPIPILMVLIPSLILPLVLIPVICWILIPILLISLISFFLNMIDCDSAILSDVARLAALVASILSFSFAFDAFLLWLLSFSWWSFWCSFERVSLSWWISSLISSFSFSFVVSSVESFSFVLSFAFVMALLSFSFVAFPAAMVSCADVHWCWTLVVVSCAAAVGIVVL